MLEGASGADAGHLQGIRRTTLEWRQQQQTAALAGPPEEQEDPCHKLISSTCELLKKVAAAARGAAAEGARKEKAHGIMRERGEVKIARPTMDAA